MLISCPVIINHTLATPILYHSNPHLALKPYGLSLCNVKLGSLYALYRTVNMVAVIELFTVVSSGGVPTSQLSPQGQAEGAGALPPRKERRRAARQYGR